MRAVVMIVADAVSEQTLQLAFIQRNDVIQQVSSAAFDSTLRHTILPRTFEGGPHGTHPQRSNDGRVCLAKNSSASKMARCLVPRIEKRALTRSRVALWQREGSL
jgi:hypothetical protein